MLLIDGSRMEGGGQIVRSAVALAAISGTPLRITHIRSGRDRPGLAPQHITAVRAVAQVCSAATTGLAPGSRELTFIPGHIGKRDIVLDVGTAGSISLVLQAWLPVALKAGGSIMVTGGTEVHRSPTIDYLARVLLPVLRAAGADIVMDIHARGYYPQGGGRVGVQVRESDLSAIVPAGRGSSCQILSCSSALPGHVADRQLQSAEKILGKACAGSLETRVFRQEGPGVGSSCTAWSGSLGSSACGRRGLPAEKVGADAASPLQEELMAAITVDLHLSDQLLIYCAEYGGRYTARTLTSHAATHIWLLEQFNRQVSVDPGPPVEIAV
ncbi:MAG: RNA 3'-terminal phosphate cyclase [Methanomicrobiales archaeon]|nr:RNA 3'-terminal phosphate cyclase [Methanomicrobiales archaeon]